MNAFRLSLVVAMVIAVSACHKDKTLPEPKAEANPASVIPQAQLDTLNKAKAVEGTLMQTDQQRREQVNQ